MSAFNYIPDALLSLTRSTAVLDSIYFTQNTSLTRAVLGSEAEFEQHLIRDAAPHELALFDLEHGTKAGVLDAAAIDADMLDDRGDGSGGGGTTQWTATKRAGPQRRGGWDKPSPLKQRANTGATEDPDRCLRAAGRLLDIYPMPRANEHVHALHQQFIGLQDTIVSLEEALKRPISRSSTHPFAEEFNRAAELEDGIRREQMEVFALEQIQAERREEIAAAAKVKPRAKPAPAARQPQPRSSPAAIDPFAKSSLLENKKRVVTQQPNSSSSPSSSPKTSRVRSANTPSGSPSTTPRKTTGATTASPLRSTPPAPAMRRTSPRKPSASASAPSSPAPASATEPASNATPRAPRPPHTQAKGPAQQHQKKKITKASAADQELLDAFADRVWVGMADVMRPWNGARRRAEKSDGEGAGDLDAGTSTIGQGANENERRVGETHATLKTILSAPPAPPPLGPSSPQHSSISTSLTTDTGIGGGADEDPLPPPASTLLEVQLLHLLLSTLEGEEEEGPSRADVQGQGKGEQLPPLTITLRDPVLASSLALAAPTSPKRDPRAQEPMVSMNALKSHLASFAKQRGFAREDADAMPLATSAIYGLVSKTVLRIDRRGKEGPMVGFRMQ